MMGTRLRLAIARLRAIVGSARLDDDFSAELESHLAMLTEENVGRGMTPAEARRAAVIRMGAPASLREQHRVVRGLPTLEAMLQDLRVATRVIARSPGFSAAAIVVLALGIGANTVGFTVVNAAFLRGLPVPDADRLRILSWQHRNGRRVNMSVAELQDWRAQSRSFESLAAYSEGSFNVSDDRALPEPVRGTWLTANAFGVLKQPPLVGRDFTADDERPGAEAVVIIGASVWHSRYGGDPDVLGRRLRLNGTPATIVGVMPEGMQFPDRSTIWVPFVPTEAQQVRNVRPLRIFGRLRDGIDSQAARTELNGVAAALRVAYPDMMTDVLAVRVETFTERFIGGAGRPMFFTVMGAVVFVLLIACANVANLLLSRSAYRAREMALRTALGATRGRIVRQLLIESILLGCLGGAFGLLLAFAGVSLVDAGLSHSLPYWVDFRVDYVVGAYVAAVCVLTGLVFGIAPALHVSKANQNDLLKDGGRGFTGSRRTRRFSTVMVVAELALTIVLLVGAGTLVRAFLMLYTVDLGIRTDDLMAMQVQLPAAKYRTPEARRAFFDRLEPALAAIPGVAAAAVTTGVPPLDGGERLLEIDAPGRPADGEPVFVGTVTITPRFFDVVGVPLVRGRNFHGDDGAPGAETVIVNERLASQFFPGEDPLGRRLRFTERGRAPGTSTDVWRTIVGISGRILHGSPSDAYVNAVVYIPYRQDAPASASLLVRSALPAATVIDGVRRAVQQVDRDQPVFTMQSLAQVLAQDRWWQRTWGGVFGAIALIGLVLSSVGLYALMAYAVSERTQEIGVRMALGARRGQVLWLVLRRGLVQLAMGLTLGFAAALALRRVLPGGVVGITPYDPIALVTIALLLSAVSVAACLVPARRATRVDPVIALRVE